MSDARPCAGRNVFAVAVLLALTLTFCPRLSAQVVPGSALAALRPVSQANRIAAGASLAPQTQLAGQLPDWASADRQSDTPVALNTPINISLVLGRAPAAEAAFDQLLADQQNPGSLFYHQWLTPQQVGALYGPTQADLDAIISWATAQGLTLASIEPNRIVLNFTGTLAAISSAFRTSFANFTVGADTRLSAVSAPSVPTAFSSVLQTVHGLSESRYAPQSRMSLYPMPAATGFKPQATLSGGTHLILPNDFAVIYNIASVYSGGNTGATIGSTAQHIAIIGRSRVAAADITNYENIAGLANIQPTVVLAGTDPGTSNVGDEGEATLDVDRVIGTAPGADADLVIAASTNNEDGVDIAMSYNINTLRDPIMTISFGSCEASNGQSETVYLNGEFQTAAAEGISTFIAADDSGAAGCDTSFTTAPANQSLGINALCSSTYVTCVGGTEFNDTAVPSLYWSSTNSAGDESALSYIPEGAWNEPTTVNTKNQTVYQVAAGGGGASIYIAKPSWQTGAGVPADGARDVPDVAFSSSDHDGYLGCFTAGGANCTTYVSVFSGTSAAAPGMAGIAALLNTRMGSAQGNIDPLLYNLAISTPTAFHDATIASSGVTGCTTATPSMCNNSTPGPSGLSGGLAGYALTTGYDQATGLGSLNVANLLASANTSTVATSLAVTATPNPALVNQSVTLTATLTPGTSSNTPTGTVQFYSNGNAIGSAATLSSNTATLTYSFTTAGTYAITATYSGDAHFTTSTATAVSLVVNAPSFTVTPATTSYALVSGAVTGNTDAIAITSMSSFVGAVTLGCTVTNAGGNAAGSCSLAPPAATLTAGSTSTSVLTITTSPGTSGVLYVKVTGVSGATTVSSAIIAVNLTAASFSISASPSAISLAAGNSVPSTVTLTSINGFAGAVALTCTTANLGSGTAAGSCSVLPASVTLASGGTATATVTILTTAGTTGALTATISATGDTAGATIAATSSTTVVVTYLTPTFTLSTSPATLTFTSGAATGNTDTVTLASVNGFSGPVALTCSISAGTAYYQPGCSVSPTTPSLSSGGTATATVTITSTTAQAALATQRAQLERRWTLDGGAFFAMLLFFPVFRRRRSLRTLAAVALMLCGIATLSGCSSSSSTSPTVVKSSAGNYTVTVTGNGAVSATFSLTID